ncbi:hypothetical protein ABB29_06630 [Pseudoxanthomonas dokdonensis]|uniref:histidine kinase n=1 Tax=Pseudoxanthomonas dokdonensis TaxID=344882 RepID=A0A0R0CXB9_9GAMM|nr:hypothetical protein ABB29_06630 [Pseudoxanthomonas dokdonensis]
MTRSLRWRLLLAAAAAVLVALVLSWLFMTLLFQRHLERRLQSELSRDGLALVAALSLDEQGRPALERELSDPRLQKPGGGYYWQISTAQGVLRSRSLWDTALPVPTRAPIDTWRVIEMVGPLGQSLMGLERRLVLERNRAVVIQLAQDVQPLEMARTEFGRELGLFLVLLWLVLSAAAWGQVSLGLRPLRRIRGDLSGLQENAGSRLPSSGLREIQPLTDAINALADVRERDLQVARRRAGDLAHGLKTPLAAMAAQSRRARAAGAIDAADGMDRAVAAIQATVDAELARARVAAAANMPLGVSALRRVVENLIAVLERTESGSRIAFTVEVPASLVLAVPVDTLSEIIGALLENAVRYAKRQISVSASAGPGWTAIRIEDDGPGIADGSMQQALMRGGRLDESGHGTGLGLAIAGDLITATQGSLELGQSTFGGLLVTILWPGHAGAARRLKGRDDG